MCESLVAAVSEQCQARGALGHSVGSGSRNDDILAVVKCQLSIAQLGGQIVNIENLFDATIYHWTVRSAKVDR